MATPPCPTLTVDKKPFLNALKSMRISSRARQKDEAILSFSDGLLSIKMQDTVVDVPAEGSWTGAAKIYARTLIPIVTFPPDPDPLPLRFQDDQFFIAGWSVNATWHANGVDELTVPSDASYLDLAALRHRHPDEQLERFGVLQDVRNAEQAIKAQVAQAAKVLRPVGITEADLEELVRDKLTRMSGSRD